MKALKKYIVDHTAVSGPDEVPPIKLVFFEVWPQGKPAVADLVQLLKQNVLGEYCNVDVLDGQEHGFQELGGWLGNQGLALRLMALGYHLRLWSLHTPRMVLGDKIDDDMEASMAGRGLITMSFPDAAPRAKPSGGHAPAPDPEAPGSLESNVSSEEQPEDLGYLLTVEQVMMLHEKMTPMERLALQAWERTLERDGELGTTDWPGWADVMRRVGH